MHIYKESGGSVFVIGFALVACLVFSWHVQAHHADPEQLVVQGEEEHKALHEVLDRLTEKFANDAEVQAMLAAYHEIQHQKMAALAGVKDAMARQAAGQQDAKDNIEALGQRLARLEIADHNALHQLTDTLSKKYPDDPDVKSWAVEYHETYHSQQERRQELLQ